MGRGYIYTRHLSHSLDKPLSEWGLSHTRDKLSSEWAAVSSEIVQNTITVRYTLLSFFGKKILFIVFIQPFSYDSTLLSYSNE